MRLLENKYVWVISTIVLAIGYFIGCTKDNHVLDVPTVNTGTDLVSMKVATPPTIDGTIDASWDNATKLNITPTVPDPGNALFTGYIGEKYPATIRSMYDADNVYFLIEWNDATKNSVVTPWYFNPSTSRWAQETSARTFDVNGNLAREGWGEDKLAMLWNIDFSTSKFLTQTCYASCHVFTPYMDYSKSPAVYISNAAAGNHYTNGPDEKIDMWWGRLGYMSKDASLHYMDDN
ncbi:MAG TPA: ethylbenzene dehydrogenase-related protein, partial [Chitinophagaceae bacterium]|nr:ethylbenzene dehydrogenase-related protein [Chitinophagaceae bacterium]